MRKSYRRARGYGFGTGVWLASMRVRAVTRDPRVAGTMVVIAALLLVSSFASFGSENSSAATGPLNVRGYVWDSIGNDIQGANVTVKMLNGVTLIDTQYYDATEPDGLYSVTFGNEKWNPGFTIEVTAYFDGNTDMNSTAAHAEGLPYQFVNVTLDGYVIPEFGNGFGAFLTVASFMAIVVVLVSRRRSRT